MDPKLIELLDNRPSALRNSFVIGVVRILAWLIGAFLFIVGLSILIHNFVYDGFLAQFDIIEKLDTTTTSIIGITSLAVAVLFFVVVRLCKMLIRRNLFLLELDEWRSEWERGEDSSDK
jgi:hypothetical protein